MFNSCTNLLMAQVSEPFLSYFHAKDWWMFDDCPSFHSIADFTVVHQPVPAQQSRVSKKWRNHFFEFR